MRKVSKNFESQFFSLKFISQVIRRTTSDLSTWFVQQLSLGLTHHHRALPAAGIPVGLGRLVLHSHHRLAAVLGVAPHLVVEGQCWRVVWDKG